MDVKIRKNYRLPLSVVRAIEILKQKGYAFPTSTETSVVEKAVYDAWEKYCKGVPFPESEKVEHDP